MLRKLITQLAYSPTLIEELGKTATVYRRETHFRLVGLFFLGAATVIELIILVFPPVPSNTINSHAIFPRGFDTSSPQQDLSRAYGSNVNQLATIYSGLGISADDITHVTHQSDYRVTTGTLYWNTVPQSPKIGAVQTATVVTGKQPIQLYLQSIQAQKFSSVLVGHSATIGDFAILPDDGAILTSPNIVGCSAGKMLPNITINCAPTQKISAYNLTRGTNATTHQARSNDLIKYTLQISNQTAQELQTTPQLYAGDLLEYAAVLPDTTAATAPLSLNQSTDILSWPQRRLAPHQTVQYSFLAKISPTIPATAVSTVNPLSFDCHITTVFGATNSVRLQCPPAKIAEDVSLQLPEANQTDTWIFIGMITIIPLFLYLRSVCIAKEIRILRHTINIGGLYE